MSRTYQTNDFDYALPAELIAQAPLPERTASRMLHVKRESAAVTHSAFTQIESLLRPNDLLVLNNTKVFPARLHGHKASGGKIECLIERLLPQSQALAHIRASNAPAVGAEIVLSDTVRATVLARVNGLFHLQFSPELNVAEWLQQVGELPLPHYIERQVDSQDKERYQTVFAQQIGAVAAPTAGLHFDQPLLQRLQARGVALAHLTLHVGAGTFQPVRVDSLVEHRMHSEWIDVPADVCDKVAATKHNGGRVIAVGTTAVRALETAARQGGLQPYQGETDIFIYPGFQFQCVDALLTNFHLPKSTLMMLVSAFAGYDLIMSAYLAAVAERYRFFSYGDAMFIE